MYDSDPEVLAAQRADRERRNQTPTPPAERPEPARSDVAPHLSVEAILGCDLCDAEGYRRPERTVVCDHIDHSAAARAGMEACRAALAEKGKP
jgi:hypothetical protein